jgi:histidine triad (HIT) family protein
MACLFCQIAAHEQFAEIVYENETVVAFRDNKPQAPVHILVIPREHVAGPLEFTGENAHLAGQMMLAAADVARQHGLDGQGYRLVINQGRDGGQAVFHVHMHLLGGRRMAWPPG